MTKRILASIFAFGVLLLNTGAQAQSASCYVGVQCCQYDGGGGHLLLIPLPPPTSVCGEGLGGCVFCSARSNSHASACIPTDVVNDCPGCPEPNRAGSPINTATGNTDIVESDISVPGLGGGLHLTRTWNSILPTIQGSYPFMFGTNWRSNFEQRLVINSPDGFLKFTEANSSVSSYGIATLASSSNNNQNVYMAVVPASDTTTTITQGWNGTTPTWTLVAKNGEKKTFDNATGVLLSITDRNGNVTRLSYDASNRLTTVADAAGRHLYFNYGSGSTNLVSTVTSDFGITLSYAYDGQGRLTQVTKPDNTTVSFAYDANSYITSVTDSNGKVLESHTYDVLGRGLTSSRANGVDAVTITY
jgi:YD repeat-containing protein